jgi:hypothetical protein
LLLLGGGYGAGPALARVAEAAAKPGRAKPTRAFVSRPDLRPPTLTVRHAAERTADGYLFLAPSSGPGQRGTLIGDNAGEVIWFHPTRQTAMDFRTAIYKGKPVLTWWEGKAPAGLGRGECVIFDQSYRELARFRGRDRRPLDLHEFVLTPRGTALVTLNEHVTKDLSGLGGRANATVIGGVVQELDIASGRLLFEWRSLDHVAVEESYRPRDNPWDYFHINSIEQTPDGNLLVSARNTWTVYRINRRTGEVIWRLGGKKSDFAMGKGTVTAWQHDARSHQHGRVITIFDNGAAPQVQPQSRALVIALDTRRMRARLIRQYTHHPGRLVSPFMGNAQLLPNGNLMVGWGGQPFLTEFAPSGAIRFDARLPQGGQNYRAYRFPWLGRPAEPPRLVARSTAAGQALHASWNGATEVADWQLLTGARAADLRQTVTRPRKGFETELRVPKAARYAAAIALDRSGKPLGRSKTVRI